MSFFGNLRELVASLTFVICQFAATLYLQIWQSEKTLPPLRAEKDKLSGRDGNLLSTSYQPFDNLSETSAGMLKTTSHLCQIYSYNDGIGEGRDIVWLRPLHYLCVSLTHTADIHASVFVILAGTLVSDICGASGGAFCHSSNVIWSCLGYPCPTTIDSRKPLG